MNLLYTLFIAAFISCSTGISGLDKPFKYSDKSVALIFIVNGVPYTLTTSSESDAKNQLERLINIGSENEIYMTYPHPASNTLEVICQIRKKS